MEIPWDRPSSHQTGSQSPLAEAFWCLLEKVSLVSHSQLLQQHDDNVVFYPLMPSKRTRLFNLQPPTSWNPPTSLLSCCFLCIETVCCFSSGFIQRKLFTSKIQWRWPHNMVCHLLETSTLHSSFLKFYLLQAQGALFQVFLGLRY